MAMMSYRGNGFMHRRRYVPTNSPPNQPTIGASAITSSGATLTGSGFSDPDTGDTEAAAQWQVTTAADTAYNAPIISTGDDAVHLTSYAATGLSASTNYIARVRYKDSAGNYSAWSTSASFTTSAGAVVGSPTVLTRGTQNTAGSPQFQTVVVSPAATDVTILAFYLPNTTTPSVSGVRGTWALKKRIDNAGVNATLYVFVGTGTATSGQITVSAGAGTWGWAEWEVANFPNGNQTTPLVAANTLGITHSSANTVCTVAAAQAMGAGNAFYAVFGFNGGGGSGTPRSGWTELTDQQITSTVWFESQYRMTTDTAADVTLPSVGYNGAGILLEIAHA